jgi:hypothetical protein
MNNLGWPIFGVALTLMVVAGTTLSFLSDRRRQRRKALREMLDRIRNGYGLQVLLQLRQRFADQVIKLENVRKNAEQRADSYGNFRDKITKDGSISIKAVVIVVTFTAGWAVLTPLQRSQDIDILNSLVHSRASLYGSIIAVGFALVGMVISLLAGVHGPMFGLKSKTSTPRVFAALVLLAASIAGMVYMGMLSTERSERTAGRDVAVKRAELHQYTAQLQRQRTANGDTSALQLQVAVATDNLNAAEANLAASRHLDVGLTVGALTGELVTSWSPLFATEFAVVGGFAFAGHRNRRKAEKAINAQFSVKGRYESARGQLLGQSDADPATVERLAGALDLVIPAAAEGRPVGPVTGESAGSQQDSSPARRIDDLDAEAQRLFTPDQSRISGTGRQRYDAINRF